jgi:D-alanine-D-alanine ligase
LPWKTNYLANEKENSSMKVAVVWNHDHSGIINRFGAPCPEKYGTKAIANVVTALQEVGHEVLLCEADKHLLATLERFMPPGLDTPEGMVYNLAYGIQGECRYTHLPAMLEMAGVPYTGSGPLGHALALDKVVTKVLMRDAGIPTPEFRVMLTGREDTTGMRFPLVVKPRHESTSFGLELVHDAASLEQAVRAIVERYRQGALVEEYIDGREVCIGLLGNEPPEILPAVEQDFGTRAQRILTWADKMHTGIAEPDKICPAPLSEEFAARLRKIALATFHACHCRDYARVDIRIDHDGNPFVLEINSMASLGLGGSYMLAAANAGYTPASLARRILDVAHTRYFGIPAPLSSESDAAHEVPVFEVTGGARRERDTGELQMQAAMRA